MRVCTNFLSDLQTREFQAFAAAFQSINRLIDAFRLHLPSLNDLNPKDPATRTILLTHALTDAATIKLHSIFSYADSASKQHCLTAARNMVAFGGLNLHEVGYMNPIMGVSTVDHKFRSSQTHFAYLLDPMGNCLPCVHR
jgi:hypothetical protein